MFLIVGEKLQEVQESIAENSITPTPFFHLITSDENKAKSFVKLKKQEALVAIEQNKSLAKELAHFDLEFPVPSIPDSVEKTPEMKASLVQAIMSRKELFEKKFKYRKFMDVCKWHYEPISMI